MNEILRGFLDWDVTNEDVLLTVDVYKCFAESGVYVFKTGFY